MTVALSDDAHLQTLNRQFLEIDAPTDVLSFPSGETDPDNEALYLGDVIISIERARAQAAAGGHALEDELRLLTVHGTLHLLGHDHAEEDEKAAMWAVQVQALEALGCPLRP
jgi:probable rRNA maturation factor